MKRIAVGLLLLAAPAFAQVEAREITKEEASEKTGAGPGDVAMKSPMLLELNLLTKSGISAVKFVRTMSESWRTDEAASYVVDHARVAQLEVRRLKAKKGRARLGFQPILTTTWFLQELDLTLSLHVGEREVAKVTWDDLTIGNEHGSGWSATSKNDGTLEVEMSNAEWEAIEAGPPPKLRIIVDIVGDDD